MAGRAALVQWRRNRVRADLNRMLAAAGEDRRRTWGGDGVVGVRGDLIPTHVGLLDVVVVCIVDGHEPAAQRKGQHAGVGP